MFPPDRIAYYAEKMRPLEREEAAVCAWRYEAGSQGAERFPTVRRLKRKVQNLTWTLKKTQSPKRGQVVILAHAATPATWGSVRPVMEELKRRGQPAFLVIRRGLGHLVRQGLHEGHATMEQLLGSPSGWERARIRSRSEALAARISDALAPYPDGGASRWLAQGLLARSVAKDWLAEAALVLADCEIEAWRKGFFLGAGDVGIPTVILQHGLFGPHHFPMHARFLFTWGHYFCNDAESHGLGDTRCEPLGCPRWDNLLKLREAPGGHELNQRLGLDATRPVVLLISNAHGAKYYPGHYDSYFAGVRALLEARGIQVLLRLHPAEKDLRHYVGRIPEKLLERLVVCPHDFDIYSCLKAANIVYHVFSTAALEAIALGIPVLYERGAPAAKLCDFPEHGGGQWVTPGTVVKVCHELAAEGDSRRRVIEEQDVFCRTTLASLGRSTGQVVDRLEQLVPR